MSRRRDRDLTKTYNDAYAVAGEALDGLSDAAVRNYAATLLALSTALADRWTAHEVDHIRRQLAEAAHGRLVVDKLLGGDR